ncbi:hypothetical protein [uncultured Draconibacterium sp.]|uniref:hypothetical protein n=1 Tax=uncultured Draconibacterium sp. TaxID=1573823 RepID=UPI002AA960DB|nr:hypothetical protein [uncultured Draconibacterium sp.]
MSKISKTFRVYHRYLGFFLAGIMTIYALSGTIMIFRTTDFLKQDKITEREIGANVPAEELGGKLFIRNLQVLEEDANTITFQQGSYDKTTGVATYTVKELPFVLKKLESLHKATTNSPLYFLNIFFGLSLLFFSVSAFFMYTKTNKVLRKGVYVAIAGLVFAAIIVFI